MFVNEIRNASQSPPFLIKFVWSPNFNRLSVAGFAAVASLACISLERYFLIAKAGLHRFGNREAVLGVAVGPWLDPLNFCTLFSLVTFERSGRKDQD